MPCWQHEAGLATLSNTWFLCDRCREAMGFARDVAVALERAASVDTLQEALAESPTKAGSASAALDSFPPSPPPGAQPERDPALDFFQTFSGEIFPQQTAEIVRVQAPAPPIHHGFARASLGLLPEPASVTGYLSNVDRGDEA